MLDFDIQADTSVLGFDIQADTFPFSVRIRQPGRHAVLELDNQGDMAEAPC